MTLAVMFDLPHMTSSRYGATMRALNFDRRRPPELKVHAAWEKDDGDGWQIFEVWESKEAFDAFLQEHYSQALRGRGREFKLTFLSTDVHQVYTND